MAPGLTKAVCYSVAALLAWGLRLLCKYGLEARHQLQDRTMSKDWLDQCRTDGNDGHLGPATKKRIKNLTQ